MFALVVRKIRSKSFGCGDTNCFKNTLRFFAVFAIMNLETLPSFALSQILTCLHMDDVCRSLVRASKTMVTSLSDAITNVHIDCTGKRKALAGPGILQMLARLVINVL